jgi:hypothetical protein
MFSNSSARRGLTDAEGEDMFVPSKHSISHIRPPARNGGQEPHYTLNPYSMTVFLCMCLVN